MSIVDAYMGARRQMQAEEQARQELALRQAAEQRAAESHALQMEQQRAQMADQQRLRTAVEGVQAAASRTVPENLVEENPAMVPDQKGMDMALRGLAAARGDTGTLLGLDDRAKAQKLKADEQVAFSRLNALSDEDLAAQYGRINADPKIPFKVEYDSKARKFVQRFDDGKARTYSRGDAIEGLMGLWRAENGDVAGGMQVLHQQRKDQRANAREDMKDSVEMAKLDQHAQQAGDNLAIQQGQLAVARGHLGIAGADAARRREEFDAGAGEREAKRTIAKLKTDLANADDTTPEGQQQIARIQAKLQALATGTRGAGGAGHDPAVVKAAQALVAANPGMDQSTALDIVISKPDQLHKSFVEIGMKDMLPPETAVERADVVMQQMGWKRAGSRWTRTGGGASAPAAAAASAAGIPAAADRKVGQTYQTPKGPMVWRGNGWEPAS